MKNTPIYTPKEVLKKVVDLIEITNKEKKKYPETGNYLHSISQGLQQFEKNIETYEKELAKLLAIPEDEKDEDDILDIEDTKETLKTLPEETQKRGLLVTKITELDTSKRLELSKMVKEASVVDGVKNHAVSIDVVAKLLVELEKNSPPSKAS